MRTVQPYRMPSPPPAYPVGPPVRTDPETIELPTDSAAVEAVDAPIVIEDERTVAARNAKELRSFVAASVAVVVLIVAVFSSGLVCGW